VVRWQKAKCHDLNGRISLPELNLPIRFFAIGILICCCHSNVMEICYSSKNLLAIFAVCSSETSIDYHGATRSYVPEDKTVQRFRNMLQFKISSEVCHSVSWATYQNVTYYWAKEILLFSFLALVKWLLARMLLYVRCSFQPVKSIWRGIFRVYSPPPKKQWKDSLPQMKLLLHWSEKRVRKR
jgi:hypothetical protein